MSRLLILFAALIVAAHCLESENSEPDQDEILVDRVYHPSEHIQKSWLEHELDQIRLEFTAEFNRKFEEQAEQFARDSANTQREINRLMEELGYIRAVSENKQRDIDSMREQLHGLSERLNNNNPGTDQTKNRQADNIRNGLDDQTLNSRHTEMSAQYANDFIGFMASPLDDYFYANQERIIFDNVFIDSSNSYNATDSAFTCPFSGYYQFTVTIANLQEEDKEWKRIDAQLYIGDTTNMKAIASKSTEGINQSTVQYLAYCTQQEQVFVQSEWGDGSEGEMRGIFGPYHSSFSGYLISADN